MNQMPGKDSEQTYDAIIIGAGLIGLATAWEMSLRGATVAVVEEADLVARGASNVAAGMLAPIGELEFGEEGLLEMGIASAGAYPEFVSRLEGATGISVGYNRCGALHVALDRDEASELRRRLDFQRGKGLEVEWLGPSDCRDLEPGLTPSFHGGVLVPGEASVDPRALCAGLSAALAGAGVEVHTGATIAGALGPEDRLEGVHLADGREFHSESVVLAAGARSGQVEWLPAEARPAVRPVKGQVVELRGDPDNPISSRILGSERVYVVPRPDGRVILGATVEEMGFDTAVTAGGVHELLREAYRLLPDIVELEMLGAVAGLRPATPDNIPIIGRGALAGLILATGHYRNGILLAPLTATSVAQLVATGRSPEIITSASPLREALNTTKTAA